MPLGTGVVGELDDTNVLSGGTYEDVTASVSFGSERTPSGETPTFVFATLSTQSTGGNEGRIEVEVDEGDGTFETRCIQSTQVSAGALANAPDAVTTETATFYVPEGGKYRVVNVNDPAGANAIDTVHEVSL